MDEKVKITCEPERDFSVLLLNNRRWYYGTFRTICKRRVRSSDWRCNWDGNNIDSLTYNIDSLTYNIFLWRC